MSWTTPSLFEAILPILPKTEFAADESNIWRKLVHWQCLIRTKCTPSNYFIYSIISEIVG